MTHFLAATCHFVLNVHCELIHLIQASAGLAETWGSITRIVAGLLALSLTSIS